MTQNLDNFIITLNEKEYEKLRKIANKKKCKIEKIGGVI